ncbi:MAG: 3-oxoadipate enol-lactonase [Rhodospirillales bacterium]|nr:3-oxoadipate enol-lactonase [Rhodospirillales bacterium]
MSSTIHANGIRINARIDGPDGAPVVMFSNSLMSNLDMWDAQMAALTARYRVLRYDQRGHGGTETTPGPYTTELLAEDAFAVIEAMAVGPVHFVGLSMGGFTAQMLAVRRPEVVRSLVLCDTACAMPPESLWNERIDVARTQGIEALAQGTLERWFTAPFHETGKAALETVRTMILGTGADGYIACAEGIRDMRICDNLGRIKAPTLVLVGESDPACPVESAEVLHTGISGSELIVLKGAAHLPNIEQSEEFNRVLLDFLDRQ